MISSLGELGICGVGEERLGVDERVGGGEREREVSLAFLPSRSSSPSSWSPSASSSSSLPHPNELPAPLFDLSSPQGGVHVSLSSFVLFFLEMRAKTQNGGRALKKTEKAVFSFLDAIREKKEGEKSFFSVSLFADPKKKERKNLQKKIYKKNKK